MATEPFDKRYDIWAAAEAEVYKAMGQGGNPEELQALRVHADLLLSELWGDDEPPLPTQAVKPTRP